MIRVKNWAKFQHFKDRRPPWVKLYRDILDDLEWHELDPAAAKALVMIWLIASEDCGRLPDTKKLAFRLRVSEKLCKSIVSSLSHWLEQDDISPISGRYQVDAPETEVETEVETDLVPTVLVGSAAEQPYRVPSCPHEEIAKSYAELLPVLPQVAVLSDVRKGHITARWREICADGKLTREQGAAWFRDFFAVVAKSAFLTGNGKPNRDGRIWAADFDWLMLPTNFVKVVEGRYQDRRAA